MGVLFLNRPQGQGRAAKPLPYAVEGNPMAGTKTGTPTIIKLARKICQIRAIWGAGDLATKATPEFAAAVAALAIACAAFEALDDFPGQIDATSPIRSGEDISVS